MKLKPTWEVYRIHLETVGQILLEQGCSLETPNRL